MSRPIYKQMLALHKRMKAEGVKGDVVPELFNVASDYRNQHYAELSQRIQTYIANNASILKTNPEVLIRDLRDFLKDA